MSLYRKYRPQKFEDVIGQEHIVQTLRGAIFSGIASHAYIFTGTRGTGKTSVARIFAKAVNCLDVKEGEPCGKCQVCREIASGNFLDLIEIDAASNRGIDDIRDLKEKILYSPNLGKYKVYIIDEVHMLTTEAFNALLKTLEEPPGHAIFILATTEIHKIPLTILSRCQRLDFSRIESEKIFSGLKKIAESEGIKIDDSSLRKIVVLSEGSVRDSLSYLDQIAAFAGDLPVDVGLLEDVLGFGREEELIEFLDLIADKKLKEVISKINEVVDSGRDLDSFIKNLLRFLRQIMIHKIEVKREFDFSNSEDVDKIKDKLSISEMVSLIDVLSDILRNTKFSFLPELYLEIGLAKFLIQNDVYSEKSSNILGKIKTSLGISKKEEVSLEVAASPVSAEEKNTVREEAAHEVGRPIDGWGGALLRIKEEKISLYMALQGSEFSESDESIQIKVFQPFLFNRINERDNVNFLEGVFQSLGKNKKLSIVKGDKKAESKSDVIKEAMNIFGGSIIE